MIAEAKDSVVETAQEVVRDISKHNPLMVIVVVLLGWYVWQDHTIKDELVNMKLVDQQQTSERSVMIDGFTNQLLEMQAQDEKDRALFVEMITKLKTGDKTRFTRGEQLVSDLRSVFETELGKVNEKLDLVIQNQQIRSVVNRPDGRQ